MVSIFPVFYLNYLLLMNVHCTVPVDTLCGCSAEPATPPWRSSPPRRGGRCFAASAISNQSLYAIYLFFGRNLANISLNILKKQQILFLSQYVDKLLGAELLYESLFPYVCMSHFFLKTLSSLFFS